MKNIVILGASIIALAACTPQVPNSAQGVGFNDYAAYELDRAQREAALRGDVPAAGTTNGGFVTPGQSASTDGISTSDLNAAGINGGVIDPLATSSTATINPLGSQTALGSNPEISDEQNFGAVSSRESIESDAQRRDRQAAAYQLIEATALPDRSGDAGPNIVQYALQAPNNRGESVFNRSGFSGDSRFQRNCAKYRTPDEAQRDFLTRGGPSRDRLGIDPDGDGFACGWDPQAFRTIAAGN